MATIADLSKAKYPEVLNGNKIIPMQGMSLVQSFNSDKVVSRTLYWEHEGNRGIRRGNWKLVSEAWSVPAALDSLEILPLNLWELYDMEKDRSELNNLANIYPEIVKELASEWQDWASRAAVVPKPPEKLRFNNNVRKELLKKIAGEIN